MECITCHDPHAKPEDSSNIEWFRSRCLTCHGSEEEACEISLGERRDQATEGSCVECHMPSRDVNDVPHTPLTDHRILRHSKINSEEKREDAPTRLFPKMWFEKEVDIPPSLIRRANGILMARYAFQFKDADLAEKALRMLRDAHVDPSTDHEAAVAIGWAYSVGKNLPAAIEVWSLALQMNPMNEQLLELIGTSFHEQGQHEQACEVYANLLEANPFRPLYFSLMVHAYGEKGDTRKALAAADQALTLNPGFVQVHHWLANVQRAAGNTQLALKHQKMVDLLLPSEDETNTDNSTSPPDSEREEALDPETDASEDSSAPQ